MRTVQIANACEMGLHGVAFTDELLNELIICWTVKQDDGTGQIV